MGPLEQLHEQVRDSAAALAGGEASVARAVRLERPPRVELGDYSTNAAMLLAPRLGSSPREVAERLGTLLAERLGDGLTRTEVAGPGFLNLHLSGRWFAGALAEILAQERFGGAAPRANAERINLEFVSANPTGPLHIGHARWAAYGDSLARLLEFRGESVTREFYVNDYGSQVTRLAESVRAHARGEPVAADGYQGDYVAELIDPRRALELDDETLAREITAACLQRIAGSLEAFRVHFDVWTSERALHESGVVDGALAALAASGASYSSEGATWLRTSAHGDDKDRVLIRSDGEHTYFTSDIGYLLDKRARGFDRIIFVWGADHHGFAARVRAAGEALGEDPARIEVLLGQFVHLLGSEGRAAMSKREGEYVTLEDLVAQIGVDAARFFLVARSHERTVELDLDLAVRQSADNPVYYVQYAHARIASMLARLGEQRVARACDAIAGAAAAPLHRSERMLLARLLALPAELAEAAERRAPHRVASAVVEIAQEFTAFYRDCRVIGADGEGVEARRIALCVAAQRTLATGLGLLGVSAPEVM